MVFTKNISSGGLLFSYDDDIPPGTTLDLKINFTLNQPPILCGGQVLRCVARGRPAVHDIAARFLSLRKAQEELIDEHANKFYEV